MVPGAPVPKVQALREPTPKGRVVSGVKVLLGTLFVLASILYANVAFFDVPDSQPHSVDGGAVTATHARCPKDAVRLITVNDREGHCIPADDFPADTELSAAAEGMSASCSVGAGVVSIEDKRDLPTEIVGWCDRRAK